ncbi:MAG: membrane protein of unknown function [Promethearchaeota archaeon]|nr:MAG: membrane protein of unknown function [Candidatus Lokiarchaeota archaeon]
MSEIHISFIFFNPINFLFSIIRTVIFLLANYWIIQSSAYEKEINIDKAELFKTAAIINIIVAIISYFVPTLSFQGDIPQGELLFFSIYTLGLRSLQTAINLITFGILFLLIGMKNIERSGNFLMISAILRFFNESLGLTSHFLSYFWFTTTNFDLLTFSIISSIIGIIGTVIQVISLIFLMLYASRNDDRKLMYAAITLILLMVYSYIAGLLIPFLSNKFSHTPI